MTVARNLAPSFTRQVNALGSLGVPITAANTKSDGASTIGTDSFLVLTAGTNDTYVESVRFAPTATTAATATAPTVARVFLCSVGTGATTSATATAWGEVQLPAVTADHSTTAAPSFDLFLDKIVPAGYFLIATNHVAPNANTAWKPYCHNALDY